MRILSGRRARGAWCVPALLILAAWPAGGTRGADRPRRTDTVLILHTNDLHASLKPRADGTGGLALVSGFVRQVRAQRKDVLLLDAGDVCEKGDMLGIVSEGERIYAALGAIGYDAGAPGNHDFVYGMPKLVGNVKASGFPLIDCNTVYQDTGKPVFPASLEKDVDGVRVGIIGGTISGGGTLDGREVATLPLEQLGKRLHEIAQEMEPRVQLTVAVLHQSSASCRKLHALAPEIDVFVSGHSHEVLNQPIRIEPEGTLIVQTGEMAQRVGELELTIDLDTEEIVRSQGRLVAMDPKKVRPDTALADDMRKWNEERCPEAGRVVGRAPQLFSAGKPPRKALGPWLADAIRDQAGADAALFDAGLIRRQLTPGPVTEDDLYATVVNGNRRDVVIASVKGERLLAYLEKRLAAGARVELSGAKARYDARKKRVAETDIEPGRTYRVAGNRAQIMPPGGLAVDDDHPEPAGYTVTDAAIAYARRLGNAEPGGVR